MKTSICPRTKVGFGDQRTYSLHALTTLVPQTLRDIYFFLNEGKKHSVDMQSKIQLCTQSSSTNSTNFRQASCTPLLADTTGWTYSTTPIFPGILQEAAGWRNVHSLQSHPLAANASIYSLKCQHTRCSKIAHLLQYVFLLYFNFPALTHTLSESKLSVSVFMAQNWLTKY